MVRPPEIPQRGPKSPEKGPQFRIIPFIGESTIGKTIDRAHEVAKENGVVVAGEWSIEWARKEENKKKTRSRIAYQRTRQTLGNKRFFFPGVTDGNRILALSWKGNTMKEGWYDRSELWIPESDEVVFVERE